MGRSIYRYCAFRLSIIAHKLIASRYVFLSGFCCCFVIGLSGCGFSGKQTLPISSNLEIIQPLKSVAALGILSPLGEIRQLAAPVSGFGGTPRVLRLLVKEGDSVKKGQKLAVFDNQPQILADLEKQRARLNTLNRKTVIQKKEISRYQEAAFAGAVSKVLIENKQQQLINFEGQRDEVLAEIKGLETDLGYSELISPIEGLVLRLHTREGERPGLEGVLEVGASQFMQALIEVYESDVSKVEIGQEVSLISENGGFKGTLLGRVQRISPQVRQRKVLSTDPTGDADARVVEVQVKLLPGYSESVSRLSGIKVIARFKP